MDKLFTRAEVCPICGQKTDEPYYKASSFRILKTDYDLYKEYKDVNPLCYEARFCNYCGYANTIQLFNHPTENKVNYMEGLQKLDWHPWTMPEEFSPEFAIKVHKLILLNKMNINSKKYGEIGIVSLRLYWLYKLVGNKEEMTRYRKQCIHYLELSYSNEDFPVGNSIDMATACYLIGVFYYDEGNIEKCKRWLSNVLECKPLKPYMRERLIDFKEKYINHAY